MLSKFESYVITELQRIAKVLEVTATCHIKQTQIAEQSFKEAKELRDYTLKKIREQERADAMREKAIDERIARTFKDEVKS